MADFEEAFEIMIQHEGGYKLTDIKGDRGGQTYAGISRNSFPNWYGWKVVDSHLEPTIEMVKKLYKMEFWDKIKGDEIKDQEVANSLFDFAVNVGVVKSVKCMQKVLEIKQQDGVLGSDTLEKINLHTTSISREETLLGFFMEKIKHYTAICNKNPTQNKFLLGWINRTLSLV